MRDKGPGYDPFNDSVPLIDQKKILGSTCTRKGFERDTTRETKVDYRGP